MDRTPMNPQGNGLNFGQTPPLMNPPPQVFGRYSADTSPLSTSFAQQVFNEDPNSYSQDEPNGDNEQGDPKRRRIARACDMCRKKKIKCDGKMPKCSHCENYKTECIFTQVEKKRQPPKGAKYIEGLENRLGRMESLLRMSGLLAEDDGGRTDLGTLERRLADKAASSGSISAAASPQTPGIRTEGSISVTQTPQLNNAGTPPTAGITPDPPRQNRKEREVEVLADQMCSLVTNTCGEARYIGSSSGFSIFSPKGIQWVSEKTGDTSFQDMIASAAVDDQKFMYWKPEIFADIFNRRTFKPLPPKAEALSLLKDFFQNFNCMFPLFHEPTFMHLVDRHYSMEPYEGSGWWASLNVALAIAHRIRVMGNSSPQVEDQNAWGYIKNALAVQTELTMRNNDLLSVQALIGMAMFLQGTPNPQPSFFLVAAALRLAHSIGLHKRGSDFNLNEIESEQRKRVFWIAYMMDKDICLRSGRPPVQDDDDMNVDLPSEDPPDNVGNVPLADGKGKVNLFRIMCVFATIQAKVYKQLYSVKASRQSDGELLNNIGELDQELETWKESIPADFRPENDIKALHTPLVVHVVVMHFAYYNCLTTIHRMSVHHGYWTSRLSDYALQGLNARPLNPRVFMSAALCVNAARTSISLIKYIPHGDHACVWLILYYPVSALVTLFANILQNPQDVRARSDLKLMDQVVTFLSMICSDETNGFVRRMLSICAEFERIAKVALDKVERELRGRGKRKAMEREKEAENVKSLEQQQLETQAAYRPSAQTLSASVASSEAQTPATNVQSRNESLRPPDSATSMPTSGYTPAPEQGRPRYGDSNGALNTGSWLGDISTPGGSNLFPQAQTALPTYGQQDGFSAQGGSYPDTSNGDLTMGGSFQQPFVPQDLWQMPMTLEWDWADVGAMGMGFGFDDGQFQMDQNQG